MGLQGELPSGRRQRGPTEMSDDLLQVTPDGLYCRAGGFYVDPWRPVDRAVVTHAHADHTRPGSKSYLTSLDGEDLVRLRTHEGAVIESLPYGERKTMGGVTVSLHPAGHILGSAQVRIEAGSGETWVVGGDYKTDYDPTCAPFEPVPCDVFVTESTFGLPVFEWTETSDVARAILDWWRDNAAKGRTSLLCSYALGKSQRILSELNALGLDDAPGPIGVHGALDKLMPPYRRQGILLPETVHASEATADALRGQGLIVAPPSTNGTPWTRKFGDVQAGFASGWMTLRGNRRRQNFDRGFVVSDHADWPGLLGAIDATGAERVLVTHGYVDPLVRFLRESRGLDAAPLATPFGTEEEGPEENAEPAP